MFKRYRDTKVMPSPFHFAAAEMDDSSDEEMTREDFLKKHGIYLPPVYDGNPMDPEDFFKFLDILYTQFSKDKMLEVVADFYDHANELYNYGK